MSTIIERLRLVLNEYREKGCTNAVISIKDMERLLMLAATSLLQEKAQSPLLEQLQANRKVLKDVLDFLMVIDSPQHEHGEAIDLIRTTVIKALMNRHGTSTAIVQTP